MSRSTAIGLLGAILLLSGCGGGSHPGEVKGSLALSDGRYANRPADLWFFTARQSGKGATVFMRSHDLDSAMVIGTVESDGSLSPLSYADDLGEGDDEGFEVTMDRGAVLFLIATTPRNGPETGPYSLDFSKEFADIHQVQVDPGQVILTPWYVTRLAARGLAVRPRSAARPTP